MLADEDSFKNTINGRLIGPRDGSRPSTSTTKVAGRRQQDGGRLKRRKPHAVPRMLAYLETVMIILEDWCSGRGRLVFIRGLMIMVQHLIAVPPKPALRPDPSRGVRPHGNKRLLTVRGVDAFQVAHGDAVQIVLPPPGPRVFLTAPHTAALDGTGTVTGEQQGNQARGLVLASQG